MSITDVKAYAHLTDADVEALGAALDAIRAEVVANRGEADAAYIRTVIKAQRTLSVAARLTLFASPFPPAWFLGTGMLALAKIIENMEIGHNVLHGQWDWMNDPEIHSSTWEWDNVCPSEHWKHSHNVVHHTWTNVVGKDRDVGYGLLRVTKDYRWKPKNAAQPLIYALLASLFEFGIAFHDIDISAVKKGRKTKEQAKAQLKQMRDKIRKQVVKDYVVFPLLTGPAALSTLTANLTANVIRNWWTNAVIFCGHFPDGAEQFDLVTLDDETKPEWYLRQMMGSANISGGRTLDFLTGQLSYQIEHHLFPDLPSNRYRDVAVQVRALCEQYQIPYTTGPMYKQYGQTLRMLMKMSLPDGSQKRPAPAAPVELEVALAA